MSFDPRVFFLVAKSLGSGSPDEAALRTAVGRSYYAAFLVARDKLGLTSERDRVHYKVESALKRLNLAQGQKLGQLKRHRVEADYKLATTANWNNVWQEASSLSNDLLTKL